MDYGYLLRRAWDIVWNNKWLILLGIIVALTSGSSFGGGGGGSSYQFDDGDFERDFEREFGEDFDFEFDLEDEALPILGGLTLAILIPILCVAFVIGVVLWALGLVARGALVHGASVLDAGGATTFCDSWRAAWARGWRLIGIGILPAIPMLILLIVGAGLGMAAFSMRSFSGDMFAGPGFGGLGVTFVAVACLAAIAAFVLGLLQTFAERAAMLENTSVFESYGRGWQVLRDNLGPALVLFLIQVGIGLGIGVLTLILAPLLICLCLIIIPVMLLVNGTVTAYFSTLWTLAWRRWTGLAGGPEFVEMPPAV